MIKFDTNKNSIQMISLLLFDIFNVTFLSFSFLSLIFSFQINVFE